jgi:diguanylate cyclase
MVQPDQVRSADVPRAVAVGVGGQRRRPGRCGRQFNTAAGIPFPHAMTATPPPASRPTPGIRIRHGLLATAIAVLLLLWLVPEYYELRHRGGYFPVALHTIMESFSIVVSIMVFAVAWHAYRPTQPSNIIVLACGFLAVALLDFGHMMSYRGMPDFVTPASPQKAIAFWLCARLATAATMLAVAFRPWRRFEQSQDRHWMLAAVLAGVAAIYLLQFGVPDAWPRFFIEDVGLTPVKIGVEGITIVGLTIVIAKIDVDGILVAAALLILTSLALILYANVNDIFSLAGHVFKVAAYLIIYQVAFVASVRAPYEQLAVEIAHKESAQQQVELLSFYDPLTGLPNKALLRDRTTQALAVGARDQSRMALLLLNVDGFGNLNDSHGHAFGDEVLKLIARRLSDSIRESDSVYRTSADEFVVLLRELHDADSLVTVQEKIAGELARPMAILGEEISISVSIGIAIAPHDGLTFDALLQGADTALHKAQHAGGNTWRFFDAAMNREAVARQELRNGLRRALEAKEFVLHYQPQIDLESGAIIGVEALVRWQRAGQGLVSPALFIPEAEASGLIVPIGKWILHEACRQAAAWRRNGLAIPVVAVNLSAVQYQRDDVERLVQGALAESGWPASALELELTESVFVHDAQAVLSTVQRLKALGVRLSIDDFGTGYSSLSYLHRFPVDKLKVDQSFVRDITRNEGSAAIVGAIIQMALSLGLEAVAEGVEEQPIADKLRRLGCRQAQGYLYAKPIPAAEIDAYLRSRRALTALR